MLLDGTRWSDTGRTVRVLPDGSVDLIDGGGRTIMVEGLLGREFVDLSRLARSLEKLDNVESAECFVAYASDNTMKVFARVNESAIWPYDRIEEMLRD